MQVSLLHQVLSLIGAACILAAYVGHQLHWMDSRRAPYNLLNAVGAAILGWVALSPFQAGFVVMETVWTIVSVVAFFKAFRAGQELPADADPGQHP